MRPSLRTLARWILPVVLIAGLVGTAIWRGVRIRRPGPPPAPPLTLQETAARNRLLPAPVYDRIEAPQAPLWSHPLGTDGGAFTYNAQPFGALNARRGGAHLGDDLNGIGQENTDLGSPVFAAADGVVAYAGTPSAGWGGVVILLHRLPEGGTVQSFYGHLDAASLAVVAGERVPRGRRLGRLGLPEAVDFAHLHFEIRRGAAIDPGAGYGEPGVPQPDRLDPAAFLSACAAPAGLPSPARAASVPANIRLQPAAAPTP